MASDKKSTTDFEDRFFGLLEGNIKGIDRKTDKLVRTQEGLERRLARIENVLFSKEPKGQLPPFYRDPAVIRLFTYVFAAIILLLVIIAGLRGQKLPGIFG